MSLRAKDFRRLADLTKICLYNHLRLPPPAESPYFDMLLAAFNTYASTNEGKVLQLINREPGALSGFTTLQDKAFLTLLDNAPTGKSEMPKGLRFLDRPSSKEKKLSHLVTVLAVVTAKPELKHSTFSSDREYRDLISYVTTYLPKRESFDIPLPPSGIFQFSDAPDAPNTEHLELERILSRFFLVERVTTEVPFFNSSVRNTSYDRKQSDIKSLGSIVDQLLVVPSNIEDLRFLTLVGFSLKENDQDNGLSTISSLGCFPRRTSTRTSSCR